MHTLSLNQVREEEQRMRSRKQWMPLIMIGLAALILMGTATSASARGISMKDGGPVLWFFLILGVIIILLQLIPAAILFFSFIGTTSAIVFKGKKTVEGASAEMSPEYGPARAKR
jgi:hypothetical protein